MPLTQKRRSRYRILKSLGEGGMGQVFLAEDEEENRRVALKFLRPEGGDSYRAFFEEEVKLLSRLSHPNLIRIFDFHRDGSDSLLSADPQAGPFAPPAGPFFSMEFVEGKALDQIPKDQPAKFWIDLFVQLAQGLHYLHVRKILHRDLKPGNLMIDAVGELKILDFGLSGTRSATPGLGTLVYLPPEAFWGQYDAQSDLFSVGVLFYEILSGRLPFEKPLTSSPKGKTVPLAQLRPDLPVYFCDLIHRLLELKPDRRPRSALSAVRFLNQHVETPYDLVEEEDVETVLQKIPLIGRAEEMKKLEEGLLATDPSPALFLLTGPTGVGRSRLLEELKWKCQLQGIPHWSAAPEEAPSWAEGLAERLSPERPASAPDTLALLREKVKTFGKGPFVLAFTDLHEWPEGGLQRLRLFLKFLERAQARWIPILEFDSDLRPDLASSFSTTLPVQGLALKDLSPEESAQWVEEATVDAPLEASLKDQIIRGSGGRPLLLVESLLHALGDRGVGREENLRLPTSFDEAMKIRVQRLSSEAQDLLALVAVHPEPVSLSRASSLLNAEERTFQDACLKLYAQSFTAPRSAESSQLSLLHPSLRSALLSAFPEEGLTESHRRWAEQLQKELGETPRKHPDALFLAEHAWKGNLSAVMKQWGFIAADLWAARGQDEKALEIYERLLTLAESPFEKCVLYAHEAPVLYRLGRYDDALSAYDRWYELREDDESRLQKVKHRFYTGLVLYTAGLGKAEGRLEECLKTGDSEKYPAHRPYHVRALTLLASLHEKAGRPQEAARALEIALSWAPDDVLLGEIEQRLGVLDQKNLRMEAALKHFEKSRSHFEKAKNPQACAIAENSLGMLYREWGKLTEAKEAMERSLQLARQGGEMLQTARYLENKALVEMDLAAYGPALETMEEAQGVLEVLGSEEDRFLMKIHQAHLAVYSGNFDRAEKLFSLIGSDPQFQKSDWASASLLLLQAEKDLFVRRPAQAAAAFQKIIDGSESEFLSAERLQAAIGLCRAHILAGRALKKPEVPLKLALEALAKVEGNVWSLWKKVLEFFSREAGELGEQDLMRLLLAVKSAPSSELRLEIYGLLSLDLRRRSLNALSLKLRHAGIAELENVAKPLPEELKMDFEKNRRLESIDQSLQELLPSVPKEAAPTPQAPERRPTAGIPENRFRQYSEINRQIALKNDLKEILERVMDACIELTGAERGFLLLLKNPGEKESLEDYEVMTARHLNHRSLKEEDSRFSMTAVRQAVEQGSHLLTDNAQIDPRFHEKKSVAQMSLKSILVVPLEAEGRIMGAVYLDHRYQPDCFSEEDVTLLLAFAAQAALAIEKARMMEELKKAKSKLEEKVETQAKRIESLNHELAMARDQLKYGYEEIVGQSPGMMKVFQLLDHVTETAIPVWIHGESGTGKELVARSLHFNSPRKSASFVTENVSAIPETLLESELFGHKKGAFTHADRDRIGLFEQASGGTLFLDEIADMSLAMQAKLLRVLQEGEIRPLGANKKVKVDVRLVTASNRDLNQMVRDEKFRQDLFFRINGLTIPLPPLRERKEDLPLLVDYLIKKISRDFQLATSEMSDTAMDRLLRHRWPGNIRELEKVIRNALLFAKGRLIVPEFLGLEEGEFDMTVSREGGRNVRAEEQSEERQMILDALRRHQLDKEAVASELGISLRSLYTRLEKLGIPKKKTVLGKYLGLKQ